MKRFPTPVRYGVLTAALFGSSCGVVCTPVERESIPRRITGDWIRYQYNPLLKVPAISQPETNEKASSTSEAAGLRENTKLASGRPFYMGFTPFAYDPTIEGIERTYRFIAENGDLISHHLDDGIPWQEALEQKPYAQSVEDNLKQRVEKTKRGQKIYLAATPVRSGLADYWSQEGRVPRTGRWKKKQIDDPEALTAYLNFCRDLIRRFRPDFMAYGIEVNYELVKKPKEWARFVRFAKAFYPRLKAENPHLPLFLSLQIDEFWKDETRQREAIRQILPYTDYIAVSTYPYFYRYFNVETIPRNYFSGLAALAPEKPFAVAETGYIAQDLDAVGIKGPGSEEMQTRYVNLLLNECQKLNAEFVIWFVSRDYDPFVEAMRKASLSNQLIEIFKVFQDTGIVDDQGNSRVAFRAWQAWFGRPKEQKPH